MNNFELFNEKLEKFDGMLAENGLVGEFRAEQYPIEIEVKRNEASAQIGMFSDESKDEMFREKLHELYLQGFFAEAKENGAETQL